MHHKNGNKLLRIANRHVLAVGLGALAGFATPSIAGAQTNLIVDGSFETAELGKSPRGWNINKSQDGTSTLRSVEDPVRSGKRALLLQGRGSWMSANASSIEIHSASTYRASAWIRVKKGHARIQISYLTEHKWLGSSDGAQRVIKDEWQLVSVQSDPNKFANVTQLHIAIVSDGPDVEVYVDDVAMTLLDAKK